MSIHLQPPVTLVKTEPPTVIKNEPPEEAEEEISTDIKDTDILYHTLCEDLIKSETVLENKHLESVQTQALVKTENSPFVKTENITQINKSEDISDENVTKGTDQGVVEVQASNEHSNALSKLETDEQSVFNFSKDLNSISVGSRKSNSPKMTDFAECYKTDETTSWEKEKEKIKVIRAPMIHIKSHEYTSLAKDKHVCNDCQHSTKSLKLLKAHIKRMHRKDITMYQCPYCSYKSYNSLCNHIIAKHKSARDIQWFQCHLCESKFKLKSILTRHMKIHLKPKQNQDRLVRREKRYYCEICALLCSTYSQFKLHKLSHKTKADMMDQALKYRCNKCDYKTYTNQNLNSHKLIHLKPENIQYLYCDHCSYKCPRKYQLKIHIFTHHGETKHHNKRDETKNKHQLEKRYRYCDMCDYKTLLRQNLNRHKIIHLKPEETHYFYCYHCSYKSNHKHNLKKHIFAHFKKGEIKFDCYICNFLTRKRESIVEHIKKHSKVQIKFEINEGS